MLIALMATRVVVSAALYMQGHYIAGTIIAAIAVVEAYRWQDG